MKRVLITCWMIGFALLAQAQTFYGEASYYGPGFHGKKTASGEIYSQNKLTAAHKTLPLGTILKVTNAQNNRSVFVRVNDRGPYVGDRILDVSSKAAEILGFKTKGKAWVKVEVINPDSIPNTFVAEHPDLALQNGIGPKDTTVALAEEPVMVKDKQTADSQAVIGTPQSGTGMDNAPTAPEKDPEESVEANASGILHRPYFVIANLSQNNSGLYGLQLGVYSDPAALFELIADLQSRYKQDVVIQTTELNGKTVYRLYIGRFQNRAYADALKASLGTQFQGCFVVKFD